MSDIVEQARQHVAAFEALGGTVAYPGSVVFAKTIISQDAELTRLRAELSAASAAPGAGWREAMETIVGELLCCGVDGCQRTDDCVAFATRWGGGKRFKTAQAIVSAIQPLPAPPSAEAQPETGGECLSDRDAPSDEQ